MLIRIKNTIIRMRCYFFGHKKLDRLIIAQSIDAGYMYATIRIYKVSKCRRCGKTFCKKIDSYDKFGWYSQYLADEEERILRKRGIVSIAEAYQKIEKENQLVLKD